MTDREILFNDICIMINDNDLRNRLYILLDKYEITRRETSIALLEEDRNEYLLKTFIIGKTVKGCTKRTIEFYTNTLNFVFRYIGKTVDDITAEDIRLYIAKRLYHDKISKTTVGNDIRCLRSFFNYLANEELIQKNPMLRIESIKQEKTKKEAFTELEIENMRAFLQSNREKAVFEILLSTGCRVSELVNIKISDIDGNAILVHGKGEKDRVVYLNAKAQWALNEYMVERKDTNPYLFAGGYYMSLNKRPSMKRKDFIEWYRNPKLVDDSKPIDMCTIEQIIRRLGKKAEVKAYPHKFRRTCATFALRRGMPIEQVSKMLGHESIETTQIYLDISEDSLKEAHKKFVVS